MVFVCLFSAGCAGGIPASLHIPQGTATQQVAELRSTAETKQLVQELAVAGSHGVMDALSEDETGARVRALIQQIASALMVDLRRTLEGLQPATRQLTEDLVTTAVRSASGEFSRAMAPALRQLVDDLMGDPALRASLRGMSRELARDAVLGSNDALQAIEADRKKTPLDAVARAFTSSALLLALGVMMLVGVPLGLLWRQRSAHRQEREEASRRGDLAQRRDDRQGRPSALDGCRGGEPGSFEVASIGASLPVVANAEYLVTRQPTRAARERAGVTSRGRTSGSRVASRPDPTERDPNDRDE